MWVALPDGPVVPSADHVVRFTVEGYAGRLIAVGNGNPTDHGSHQAPGHQVFHGLALAIIRSTDVTGSVRVTAESDGLAPDSVDIIVAPGEGPPRIP